MNFSRGTPTKMKRSRATCMGTFTATCKLKHVFIAPGGWYLKFGDVPILTGNWKFTLLLIKSSFAFRFAFSPHLFMHKFILQDLKDSSQGPTLRYLVMKWINVIMNYPVCVNQINISWDVSFSGPGVDMAQASHRPRALGPVESTTPDQICCEIVGNRFQKIFEKVPEAVIYHGRK